MLHPCSWQCAVRPRARFTSRDCNFSPSKAVCSLVSRCRSALAASATGASGNAVDSCGLDADSAVGIAVELLSFSPSPGTPGEGWGGGGSMFLDGASESSVGPSGGSPSPGTSGKRWGGGCVASRETLVERLSAAPPRPDPPPEYQGRGNNTRRRGRETAEWARSLPWSCTALFEWQVRRYCILRFRRRFFKREELQRSPFIDQNAIDLPRQFIDDLQRALAGGAVIQKPVVPAQIQQPTTNLFQLRGNQRSVL